jgi:hypothetical protein
MEWCRHGDYATSGLLLGAIIDATVLLVVSSVVALQSLKVE